MNNLRAIRTAYPLTMQGLATKATVSTTTINNVENYDYVPQVPTQQKIAAALDVSMAVIWPGEPTGTDQNEGAMD